MTCVSQNEIVSNQLYIYKEIWSCRKVSASWLWWWWQLWFMFITVTCSESHCSAEYEMNVFYKWKCILNIAEIKNLNIISLSEEKSLFYWDAAYNEKTVILRKHKFRLSLWKLNWLLTFSEFKKKSKKQYCWLQS